MTKTIPFWGEIEEAMDFLVSNTALGWPKAKEALQQTCLIQGLLAFRDGRLDTTVLSSAFFFLVLEPAQCLATHLRKINELTSVVPFFSDKN